MTMAALPRFTESRTDVANAEARNKVGRAQTDIDRGARYVCLQSKARPMPAKGQ